MLATEHAARLVGRLNAIAQAAEQALAELDALHLAEPQDARRWVPAVQQALARIQLECAEATFAARELRAGLPAPDALQPRLM